MIRKVLAGAFCVLALVSAAGAEEAPPATAETPAPAEAAPPASKSAQPIVGDPNEVICKNEEVIGTRFRLNASPDLQLSSYMQYDNGSRDFGTNTRLRWTFSPLGELFVVYNHNLTRELVAGGVPGSTLDRRRWEFASNELLVKLQYVFRY